ncbi:MAG TPA: ester cyclase [Flavisolibacter sp.]
MEELTLQKDALSLARRNMLAYLESHDVQYVREDAVFRTLGTGEVYNGRADIGAMLHFMYHLAFDAHLEVKHQQVTESQAVVEGLFRGKHIGEIAGVPATGRDVSVPMSVCYDLEDGLIKEARIYFLDDVLLQQLGVSITSRPVRTTYLVRDIFHLKFGQYREAKKLIDEATEKRLMPEAQGNRILTDFTGASYRLIFEEGYESLADYELSMTTSMRTEEWKQWYEKFKPLVERSYREILKQVT